MIPANRASSIHKPHFVQQCIKSADWVIDLGLDGGGKGGEILFEGPPEKLVQHDKSITGQFLSR